MANCNDLGTKIRELRKAKKLTQEQLAEMIGIDDKHLSRIENGYHSPKYNIMQKLARVLDFNLFAMNNVEIHEISEQDKIIKKAIQIFKNAQTEQEKLCYLEALKNAHKCFKIARTSHITDKK